MIVAKDVCFSYTKKPFIKNINFEVGKGEILGFLGPSGAGKTTLQKILIGLITNYAGSTVVGGIECKAHDTSFYENIGVDFEFSTLYKKLTARQNIEFFASLYKKKARPISRLLMEVGLQNDANKKVADYSKGMRARLNFIKALVHSPDILFLDEPTSGLDPTNSHNMKEMIKREKQAGKTIIITTHNMQDATELCDKVAFIVDGSIQALDSPHNLIMRKGAAKVNYTFLHKGEEKTGVCLLAQAGKDAVLQNLFLESRLLSIHSSEPTLQDIFMEVTGRGLT